MPDTKIRYGAVLNVLDVEQRQPFEIIPGHLFRQATSLEISCFKDALKIFTGYSPEMVMEHVWSGPEMRFDTRFASESEWRYWVVEIQRSRGKGINWGLNDIERAACLTPVELKCSLMLDSNGGAMGPLAYWYDPVYAFKRGFMSGPEKFTQSTAVKIFKTHEKLLRIEDGGFDQIGRAVEMYFRLTHSPKEEALYALGLFGVLESVLTHQPKPTDPTDSIGRQIRGKVSLLSRRFAEPLDYSPFGNLEPKQIWTKLYEFRSCVAHGTALDFKKEKELKRLKDQATAIAFLEGATKAVLLQALEEPSLVSDLKNC